ncbi:YeeE/YedE thiosulfate transporter family protein [Cyanobium sp. Morenito 9A2]|uniref:YeeE/YedE thiosulfate transporter family protein n=1 Tax=Cyanobium sp. Morenito 9A2 TaxID=2823718 RepID=UPI0020CFB450|nr:YeeE/YedE thiosulfate transporter family protein [Cyanobium sp. Morenito 9A2]MCP9848500.1 YeeE/YedE family protein [Cyanobium sp. Morenito 9A2]
MVLASLGPVVGALLGSLQRPLLTTQPYLASPVLLDHLPLAAAVMVQLVVVVELAWGLQRWSGTCLWSTQPAYGGAALLALATTGAKAASLLGWNPVSSRLWSAPARSALLQGERPWWLLEPVLLDLAVVAGELSAEIAMGTVSWRGRGPIGVAELARRGAGGVLMGYGGLLASGCNVNGFFGGVMSFSLHGWIWLGAALLGSLRRCAGAPAQIE